VADGPCGATDAISRIAVGEFEAVDRAERGSAPTWRPRERTAVRPAPQLTLDRGPGVTRARSSHAGPGATRTFRARLRPTFVAWATAAVRAREQPRRRQAGGPNVRRSALVPECTTMSAPSFNGLWICGVANVFSTARRVPGPRGAAQLTPRSATSSSEFDGDSGHNRSASPARCTQRSSVAGSRSTRQWPPNRPGASLIANAVTRTDRARRPRTAPAATTQLPITALTAPRVSCVVAPASLQFANSRLACARFTRLSAYAAPARSTAVPNDRCAREAIARMRLTGELSTAISIAKSDATDDASCSMNSQHVIQRPSCWYGPGARTPLGGTPNPRSARKAPPLPRGRATARRHHATPRYSSSLARQPERVWDVRARCCRRPAGQRPGNVRSGHLRPPVPRPMLARYRISGPCPHHARPPPNGTSDCPPRNRGPTAAPGGTGRCPAADFPTPLKLACANPVAQRTWSRPFCVSAGDVPRRLVGKTPASLCRPDWNPQRTVRHEH
jgi:hypothetical protein